MGARLSPPTSSGGKPALSRPPPCDRRKWERQAPKVSVQGQVLSGLPHPAEPAPRPASGGVYLDQRDHPPCLLSARGDLAAELCWGWGRLRTKG